MNPEKHSHELTINVISESVQEQLPSTWIDEIQISPKSIEDQLTLRVLRLNHEKIRIACQIIGCKPIIAKFISDSIMTHYETIISSIKAKTPQASFENQLIYTTNEKFIQLLTKTLSKYSITKSRSTFDFEVALSIIEHTVPMIVLLGGTSGSGKSTAASLLASRFGISTVLSTDSIRHIMRNFMTTEECPVLFASTYNAGDKIKVEEGTTERKRTILGFQQQSALVQESLDKIIQGAYNKGESIIIEGVHLTPDFMASVIAKYHNCIPFLVYIRSEKKHRERFAVRSKYMTLEKKHNKYIQNFSHIREIQKHLTKKADQNLVPKVNNSNIDKSLGLIHRTIIRCLRRIATGESLYDPEKKNAIKIYHQFNEVTKNIWSSDLVKQYISSKMSQANKVELVESFLFKSTDEPPGYKKMLSDFPKGSEYNQADETTHHGDNEEKEEEKEEIEPTETNKIEDDTQKTTKFKEDFMYDEEELLEKKKGFGRFKKANNERINGGSLYEEEDTINYKRNTHTGQTDNYLIVEEQEVVRTDEFTIPLKSPRSDNEDEGIGNISPERNTGLDIEKKPSVRGRKLRKEGSYNRQNSGPSIVQSKKQIRFNELEGLIMEKKSITLKVTMTQYYLKIIQNFIDYFQKKHPDFFLKVQPHNDRITLSKQSKAENSSPSHNLEALEMMIKSPLLRLSTKTSSFGKSLATDRKNSSKMTESGTSEGEVEHSDDGSVSNVSGSLDANFHLTAKGSNTHNLSDYMDFSDDFDSTAKYENEEDSEGRTSLEIVESANSISEQSDEEDDEDDFVARPAKLVK